jgi:hypothetical protein
MEHPCVFCLEHVQTVLPNIIDCPCEYKYHAACLEKWFEEKGHRECPICHTVSILVYVERRDYARRVDRTVGICCGLLCLSWIGAFVIFRNVV